VSDALTLLVAVGFAAMGLLALARPRDVLAQFGVAVETVEGRNEVRAVYGGFGLAIAGLLVVAALGDPSTAEGIVVATGFALLGMAAGRLLGLVRERPAGLHPVWTYLAIELASAAALLAAAWS
jgi:Domain of unknown function (DUF4345)